MTQNAFIGRVDAPDDAALSEALGPAKPTWDQLIAALADEQGVSTHEWKSYSRKSGWAFRLLRKKRTIVWMAPCKNCIHVAFILGDKALHAARALSPRVEEALQHAEKYPEGTGVRLEIQDPAAIPDILRLAAIKIAN
jgi:hypothetical protein